MLPLAFKPRGKFRSISITGTYCALNCDMCRGFYLRQMMPASSPRILEKLCLKLRERGVEGFLISGGYDRRGALPIEPFLESIKRIKKMTGALISIHSGMIDPKTLEGAEEFIDFVDFEFLTNERSIMDVKKLNYTPEDYLDRMDSLSKIVRVVPHFILGLPGSSPSDVLSYVREISNMTDEVVILVLKSTPEAPRSKLSCDLNDLKIALSEARGSVPGITLSLGCMRPSKLKEVLDRYAVDIGFDRIANPRTDLIEKYKMSVFKCCCSVPTSELWRFL